MKEEDQLKEWVKGNSIHNDEYETCCPDFSCCEPCLKADKGMRERFAKAYYENDDRTMHFMLGIFLAKMLANAKIDAYVAGQEDETIH